MLKNKYLAIALVIIAIIVIANTIITMSKKSSKRAATPPLVAPPIAEDTTTAITPKTEANNMIKVRKQSSLKSVKPEASKKDTFTPYLPLREKAIKMINPRSLSWGDDPFGVNEKKVLKNQSEENLKQVALTAIIIKHDIKYAIINNIVFKEGDFKRGILLKKININSVVVASNHEEINLKIFEKKTIKLSEEKKGSK